MLQLTLLEIVQQAADRLGIGGGVIAQVVGNNDPEVRALLGYFIEEGQSLLSEDPTWQILVKVQEFNTVAGQDEYELPDDYYRHINSTTWDRNQYWQVRGAITPQQRQLIRSGLVQTARVSSNFQIVRASSGTPRKIFWLDPVPGDDGIPLVFEYVSKEWLYTPPSVMRSLPSSDNDIPLFDGNLMVLGLIWRFRAGREMSYAMDVEKYGDLKMRIKGGDTSPMILSPTSQPWVLPVGNVPDSGYGF